MKKGKFKLSKSADYIVILNTSKTHICLKDKYSTFVLPQLTFEGIPLRSMSSAATRLSQSYFCENVKPSFIQSLDISLGGITDAPIRAWYSVLVEHVECAKGYSWFPISDYVYLSRYVVNTLELFIIDTALRTCFKDFLNRPQRCFRGVILDERHKYVCLQNMGNHFSFADIDTKGVSRKERLPRLVSTVENLLSGGEIFEFKEMFTMSGFIGYTELSYTVSHVYLFIARMDDFSEGAWFPISDRQEFLSRVIIPEILYVVDTILRYY